LLFKEKIFIDPNYVIFFRRLILIYNKKKHPDGFSSNILMTSFRQFTFHLIDEQKQVQKKERKVSTTE